MKTSANLKVSSASPIALAASLLCFLAITTPAIGAPEAQEVGFREGLIFTEFAVAAPGHVSGGSSYYVEDTFALRNVAIFGRTTNSTARALALYSLFGRPQSTASTRNGRIALEYGISKRFGIGYSIESTHVRAENVPVTTTYGVAPIYLYVLGARLPDAAATPGFQDIMNAQVRTFTVAQINTVNFDVAFHGAFGRIDPYARLSFGLGTYSSITWHAGISAGVRLYLGSVFYVFGEAFGNYYRIQPPSSGGGSDDSGGGDGGGGGGSEITRGPRLPAVIEGVVEKDFSAKLSRIGERSVRFGFGYIY